MQKAVLIEGMTCAACAKRIEKVVSKIDGVLNATVNFATETLNIEYDETLDLNLAKEKIEKIGYKFLEQNNTKDINLTIEGMTCVACAKRIEKVLSKNEGIEEISVNFSNEKANIKYNSKITRLY